MPFTFEPIGLPGLVMVRPRVLHDTRGFFLESYKESEFQGAGIPGAFVQDNHSSSWRGVLRGLHFQLPPSAQGKLLRVLEGSIWDVAVDIRPDSSTFSRWYGIELSSDDPHMLYIPPGFAHGFVALTDRAQLFYKCSAEYDSERERGIRWDDSELGIDWPIRDVLVSDRDRSFPRLSDAELFPPGWVQ